MPLWSEAQQRWVPNSECDSTGEPLRRTGFVSYCPHCHTGDPGEDYCASCGERLSEESHA